MKRAFADDSSLSGALAYYRALPPRPPAQLVNPPSVRGLVVGGTTDIVDADLIRRTPALLGPDSDSLVIEGAGHWPHREGEPAFVARLIEFLRG